MSDIITCPTGLTGRIRGMKDREERILADRRLAKARGQIDELLAACWQETLVLPLALIEALTADLAHAA